MIRERLEPDPSHVLERVGSRIGMGPLRAERGVAVVAPTRAEEAGTVLHLASEEGWRLCPLGARLGPGCPIGPGPRRAPAKGHRLMPDLVLSSERMTEPLDHQPDDFNVAVGAGITLDALAAALSPEGQWLALDPPGGGDVTIGGVVAAGLAGPLGTLFGRPRDLLLGLTVVDGVGRVLELGGRVVKNVAGFDLVRLMAGSRGGLGMITQATFRLHPIPEADRTFVWKGDDALDAWALGRRLSSLPTPLAAVEVVAGSWPEPLGDGPARLLVRVLGSAAAAQQIARLVSERAGPPDEELAGDASVAIFRALSEGERTDCGSGPALRLHSLPGRGRDLLSSLCSVPCSRVAVHVFGGTVRGYLPHEAGLETIIGLRDAAERMGATLDVFGDAGRAAENSREESARARLLSEIVRGFDPAGILPGSWREGWIRSTQRGP